MDPDMCMDEAMKAYTNNDYDTLIDHLTDYSNWLDKGGFAGVDAPDVAEALYWICNDNHNGQFSSLYIAMNVNPFRPGPLAKGPTPDSLAEIIYNKDY